MEKTTSLFRFLAFDLTCKQLSQNTIDFSPQSTENRTILVSKYDFLAKINSDLEVSNLGNFDSSPRFGAQRIGNDFLTTQLKQGADLGSRDGVSYPKRTPPLLTIACGDNYWNVRKHSDWVLNLDSYLNGRGKCSYTSLVIFLLRNFNFGKVSKTDGLDILYSGLISLFTEELASYLSEKVKVENILENSFHIDWAESVPILEKSVSLHSTGDSDNLELNKILEKFFKEECDCSFSDKLVHRLTSSLLSKRFVIFTGLSGSGKTKLAQAFARWLTPDPEFVDSSDETKGKNPNLCYKVVSVGADWSGNENILGYPNGLHPEEYFTKPALELILHAANEDHKDDPHFLILDEMNLSHVERYFADILSAIESDEKIHLHRDKERKVGDEPIEQEIDLPKNLFIIGTVNIDETTHMFSPKVLDRANVIEFRMKDTELASFLEKPVKPNLDQLDGKGQEFGQAFVDAAKNPADVPDSAKLHFQCEMLLFFKVLQKHGAEFGYRVAHEAGRFVHFYEKLGGETDVDKWFKDAFDCIIVQKFLPKLHGSESKLRGVLFSLAHLCSNKRAWIGSTLEDNKKLIKDSADEAIQKGVNNSSSDDSPTQVLAKVLGGEFEKVHYPLSFEKIERMWRAAHENGFASFAES